MIQSHEQRTCKSCGFTGPLDQFSKGNILKDGTQSYRQVCRRCRTAEAKANYDLRTNHPDAHAAAVAERERAKVWRKCRDCAYEGPVDSFPPAGKRSRDGKLIYRYTCFPCKRAEWREDHRTRPRNPRRDRNKSLLRKYKMTLGQWESMFAAQGNKCAICRTDEPGDRNWHTDHDNTCCGWYTDRRATCGECVRGILCRKCNTALGLVSDDPAILQAMIDYLAASKRPKLRAI